MRHDPDSENGGTNSEGQEYCRHCRLPKDICACSNPRR